MLASSLLLTNAIIRVVMMIIILIITATTITIAISIDIILITPSPTLKRLLSPVRHKQLQEPNIFLSETKSRR